MFTEEMAPRRMPRSGFGKDSVEVEGYVRGFARRRPDVTVTMLRCANLMGPQIETSLTRYFSLPVVPTVMGFDARLQFCHEEDALAALERATVSGVHGTFNVAGDGVLMLSQAVRRVGRPTVPVPSLVLSTMGSSVPQLRGAEMSAEQVAFLTHGRGIDTARMRSVFGFEPRFTTAEAFADFAQRLNPGLVDPERLGRWEQQAQQTRRPRWWRVADAEIIPIGAKAAAGRGSRTIPVGGGPRLGRPTCPAASPHPTRSRKPRPSRRSTPPPGALAGRSPVTGSRPKSRHPRSWRPKNSRPRLAPEELVGSRARAGPRPPGTLRAEEVAESVADAAKEVFGPAGWERRLAETLAFLRHRLTGDYHVDEFGFDAEITERFVLTALRPIAQKWFRIEVRGIENIPAEGGALVVSNHSGAIPMDGLMTALVLHDHAQRSLRMLAADLVFTLPVRRRARPQGRCDPRRATRTPSGCSVRGDLVGVWPEGFKGIGKPFSERYKLQRFGRGGFVSAALRVKVPIIPCSVVGAEEIYPMVGNIPSLARLLGAPYIPITPFFPWLGLLGLVPLPSKWLIEFGEPIRTDSYGDGAADDPMLVFNVTDQVRETIQQTLYSLLMQRRGVFS